MKRRILTLAVIASTRFPPRYPRSAGPLDGITKQWTFAHNMAGGQTSEIVVFRFWHQLAVGRRHRRRRRAQCRPTAA
jgi:hypothetical protein